MSVTRWVRVRRLFEAAASLDPGERRLVLAEGCPTDLRDEVAALLEADERSDPRWERTLSARREPPGPAEDGCGDAPGPAVGDRVGPYRLLEEIGRGGMGRVLRAVRDDGLYRREVAVKLIQGPIDDTRRRRFVSEVRVLADLEHPNIARMYDGGVTDDGHPYVVMELVRGLPIDRHCEERAVPAAERVRLVAQVCRAVHHAHRHLVVHRDLKPANVLVTDEGAPVLLDFGIAKLLGDVVGDEEEATGTESVALTFAYASPEQLRSDPVTAASDVYSLGVVLYRLLTGRLPADPADGCDDPAGRSSARSPAPPSRVAVLRGLGRGAFEDLDRVVLMALAPEPNRRYGTARELAEDLERVLAGWPVAARSAGGVYRARRFVSRHRIATGVAAGLVALLLSALAGLAVSTVQARRERDEARSERLRAERLAELLEQIFETASPATLPASELSARRLVAEASARLESGMDGGDPAIQADLYAALGRIQRRIGEFAESERLLRRAVGLRAAAGDVPALAEDLSDLAESVRENGDFPAAERLHRRALELWRAHLGEDALELTGSLDALSYVLTVLGHHDEARKVAEEALEIRERHFGPDHPEVADSLGKLGNLTLTREDHRAAVDIFRRVVTMGLDEINLLPAQKNLAVALLRLGEVDEAEALLRDILADEHRLYGEEHPRIAFSLSHLGETMWARGRPEEAERYMRSALDMRRRLLGENHPAVAVSLTKLADLLASGGGEEEAAEAYRRAITIAREKFGPHSPYLADGLLGLGRLLFAGGDPAAAEPLLREALAIRRDTAPPERIAEAELELARCHGALERLGTEGGG